MSDPKKTNVIEVFTGAKRRGWEMSSCVCDRLPNTPKLRIVILGGQRAGKSAVIVRYLTGRFIGEYCSESDFIFRHLAKVRGEDLEVEILDMSQRLVMHCLNENIGWADAFVIVYSILDRQSFNEAVILLERLSLIKTDTYTVILLANKTDLEHLRVISAEEGELLAKRYSCQFYEVSAAENLLSIKIAFQSLLDDAQAIIIQKPIGTKRKLGVNSVSRVLGTIFGKNSSKENRKKRPSLSI